MPTTPDLPSGPLNDAQRATPGRLKASALKLGRLGRRLLWWATLSGATLLVLAAVAWGVLLYQILPRIDNWRLDLAEQATRALGMPVRIGQVVGRTQGVWPILSLREVQLLDAAGRVALRLPEVSARISWTTLSPRALVDREFRLDQLELVGPELDVRRDKAGDFHVAGLKMGRSQSASTDSGHGAADWVFSQARIRIAQGTVRWTDEFLGSPTLALTQVELLLRNRPGLGRRVHELSLEATPPTEFGQRFTASAAMSQPLWLAGAARDQTGQPLRWWQRWPLRTSRPSQWQTWSGTAKVNWPHVDVQRLRQHVKLPVDVNGGRGAVSAEMSLQQGLPSGLAVDVAVQDVSLRLSRQLAPLAFRQFKGRVAVTHEDERSTLSFQNLSFVLTEGLVWPSSSGKLLWRHAPWQQGLSDAVWGLTRGGEAQADRLDLALMAQLADRLPLSPGVRATLADVAPRGVVQQLAWQWDGLLEAPTRYKASGQIKGLGWAASDKLSRPGLDQADVTVTANEAGGRAEVRIRQGGIAFPGVFEEPRIPLDSLMAQVDWAIKRGATPQAPSDWRVDVTRAVFANQDASGQLEGHWRTGPAQGPDGKPAARLPGHLSLSGRLDRADATRVWRYLPSVIPKAPRDYVRLALRSGRGEKVAFEVDGNLIDFPFKNDVGGRFRVSVPLRDVALDYVPAAIQGDKAHALMGGWPAFTGLEGMLLFEGQRMVIKDARGRLGGVGSGTFALRNVEGRIEDLGQSDPHLSIKGKGDGPLDDLLRFLSSSPVGHMTGHIMKQAQATGTGALELGLDIPLDRAEDTVLQGQVLLTEADQAHMRLRASVPAFMGLRGRIAFTQDDLEVDARTRVWGHEVVVQGRQAPGGVTRFVAQGVMSAEGLRQAQEFPFLQKLAERLTGEAPFHVTVAMTRPDPTARDSLPEVQVSSSLQGMAANLPAPLNKPAQALWPIRVTHRLDDVQGHGDTLQVDLGNPQAVQMSSATMPWLHVDLRRDTRSDDAHVARGSISLIMAGMAAQASLPALPSKGVAAQALVPVLDLDAWSQVAKGFQPAAPLREAAANAGATATAARAEASADSYLPDFLSFKTGELVLRQRSLKDVSGSLAHPSPGVWRAQLDSQQIAGLIEWVPDASPLASGPGGSRVVARLSRLLVPPAEAKALQEQAAEQMLSAATSSTLPALDIVIDQFEWRGLPLGRLEVEALNRSVTAPGALALPEWRLTKFRLSTPEAQLHATGNWTALGAQAAPKRGDTTARLQPRSAFGFTLDLQNSGALLTRLGLPQTIKGGKGKLAGQVSWLGSPLEPDALSMAGDISVQISEGQFLKVDPGMAKLLGVLSLQSLPRRLTLDFRDVFQEGFAFDGIDGDVKIAQGAATTRNLRMRGVQAVVLMEGQADLARETQNLHVYVVPDVNAGGASLAYAAINPVIGLGTFLAQVLFRKQVAEAGTQEFKVTGPWANPQVEKLSTRSQPPAQADAASAAPGAVTKPQKPS